MRSGYLLLAMAAPVAAMTKSIDFYANFPARLVDFLVGNNSHGWANTTRGLSISEHTRTVYQCCNGFLLGADGMQEYSHGANNGTDTWGQVCTTVSAFGLAVLRCSNLRDHDSRRTSRPENKWL